MCATGLLISVAMQKTHKKRRLVPIFLLGGIVRVVRMLMLLKLLATCLTTFAEALHG